MYKSKAYSAASAKSPLASTTIARRDPAERDVQIVPPGVRLVFQCGSSPEIRV